MRLCTKNGDYTFATGRRRRQLAAMPTIWCNARVMRQAANRAHNRMQARAHTPAFTGTTIVANTPPQAWTFDTKQRTVAVLVG